MCQKRARSCFSESVFNHGDSFAVLKRQSNEKELLLSVLIQHFVQQPLFMCRCSARVLIHGSGRFFYFQSLSG